MSGDELAALLSKLRGYAMRYEAPPELALRLFVPELYTMKRYWDKNARAMATAGAATAGRLTPLSAARSERCAARCGACRRRRGVRWRARR